MVSSIGIIVEIMVLNVRSRESVESQNKRGLRREPWRIPI